MLKSFDDELGYQDKLFLLKKLSSYLYSLLVNAGVSGQFALSIAERINSIPPVKGVNELALAIRNLSTISSFKMVVIDPKCLSLLNERGTGMGNSFLKTIEDKFQKEFNFVFSFKDGAKRIFCIPSIPENSTDSESMEDKLIRMFNQKQVVAGNAVTETLGITKKNLWAIAYADVNKYMKLDYDKIYQTILNAAKGENINGIVEVFFEELKPEEYIMNNLFGLMDRHELSRGGEYVGSTQRAYKFVFDNEEEVQAVVSLATKAREVFPHEYRDLLWDYPNLSPETKKALMMINRETYAENSIRIDNPEGTKEVVDILNLDGWHMLQENLNIIDEPQVLISRTGGDEYFINVWDQSGRSFEISVDLAGVGASNVFMGRANTDHFIFSQRAKYIIEEINTLLEKTPEVTEADLSKAMDDANNKLKKEEVIISKQDVIASCLKKDEKGTRGEKLGEAIWNIMIEKYGDENIQIDKDGNQSFSIKLEDYWYYYNKIKPSDDNKIIKYLEAREIIPSRLLPNNMETEIKIDFTEIDAETYLNLYNAESMIKKNGLALKGVVLPENVDINIKREFADNLVTLMKASDASVVTWQDALAKLLSDYHAVNKTLVISLCEQFLTLDSLTQEQIDQLTVIQEELTN